MKNIWKEIILITVCIVLFDLGIVFTMENLPGEATKAAEYKHEIVRTQKTIYYFMFQMD